MERRKELNSFMSVLANQVLEQTKFLIEIGADLNSMSVKIDGKSIDMKNVGQLQKIYDQTLPILEKIGLLKKPSAVRRCSPRKRNSALCVNNDNDDAVFEDEKCNDALFGKRRRRRTIAASVDDVAEAKQRRMSKPIIFHNASPLPDHLVEPFSEMCKTAKQLFPDRKSNVCGSTFMKETTVACPHCEYQVACYRIAEHLLSHDAMFAEFRRITRCPLCGDEFQAWSGMARHLMYRHFA